MALSDGEFDRMQVIASDKDGEFAVFTVCSFVCLFLRLCAE